MWHYSTIAHGFWSSGIWVGYFPTGGMNRHHPTLTSLTPAIHPSRFRWYITKRGPKRGITETYSDVFFPVESKSLCLWKSEKLFWFKLESFRKPNCLYFLATNIKSQSFNHKLASWLVFHDTQNFTIFLTKLFSLDNVILNIFIKHKTFYLHSWRLFTVDCIFNLIFSI